MLGQVLDGEDAAGLLHGMGDGPGDLTAVEGLGAALGDSAEGVGQAGVAEDLTGAGRACIDG